MVSIEINGQPFQASEQETLLEAIRRAGIEVPTLCHMEGLVPSGACRMCVVEVAGQRNLVTSCCFPVHQGLKVKTHSQRAVSARRTIVELLLADHPDDCLYCERNGNCQLQTLAQQHGIRQRRYRGERSIHPLDTSSPSIVRDPAKCVLCGKCVRVCEEIQTVAAIDFVGRGSQTRIDTAFQEGLNISSCVHCGQCVTICPTGALTAKGHIGRVLQALSDEKKFVVVQHAPSVSVTLGEELGLPPGTDVDGLMVAALRRLGFDRVFDTGFSADLTIMEEASELIARIKSGGRFPMMTSCSPGWIKFVETFYPDFLGNLSTCKSPQQMLGAIIKSCFAEQEGLAPESIFSVSVMPCTAKKFEAERPEMTRGGASDIDAVLTTRELAQLLRMGGIDIHRLEPVRADDPFGSRTTAGKLFGATGGVMEAALRTAHWMLAGSELPALEFQAARGLAGVKETTVEVLGTELRLAVVNGLGNARRLLDAIRQGKEVHFVEVMTCPGGCIAGGGQPIGHSAGAVQARMQSLYQIDRNEAVRVSHKNEAVQRLYDEFLGQPLSERSHELLHTHYAAREALI